MDSGREDSASRSSARASYLKMWHLGMPAAEYFKCLLAARQAQRHQAPRTIHLINAHYREREGARRERALLFLRENGCLTAADVRLGGRQNPGDAVGALAAGRERQRAARNRGLRFTPSLPTWRRPQQLWRRGGHALLDRGSRRCRTGARGDAVETYAPILHARADRG
jgi:hypothetical protein